MRRLHGAAFLAATSTCLAQSCKDLLIDDFASQSRLTYLNYNALLQPSSDDGTMADVTPSRIDAPTSVIVSTDNHMTLTPKNASSYWYSEFGNLKVSGIYGGIGMTINAPVGTTMGIELQSSNNPNNSNPALFDVLSTDLGWKFDGTNKYFSIPFSSFKGLDTDHLRAVLFSGLSNPITVGPLAFYCGEKGSAYPPLIPAVVTEPVGSEPVTRGPTGFVIDSFRNPEKNDLNFYHGGDNSSTYRYENGRMKINMMGDSDLAWYTQVTDSCTDYTINDKSYVHLSYSGSNEFSVILQQHNPTCSTNMGPVPLTWDAVEASRYSNTAKTDIYIPISHFDIDRTKVIGFGLKGFYSRKEATTISKIEIVSTVPSGTLVPSKIKTAPLYLACTRPNSFAFAIDDGDPRLAAKVMAALTRAKVPVTFFTVGAALQDPTTNLSAIYAERLRQGDQIAYHSYTHPPMEGLPSLAAIDWELRNDMQAVQSSLSGHTSTYFRPPFGTEGARVRQRLAATIPKAKFVEWSIDVEDYLWATGPTPEKQIEAFQRDVKAGGNLVVMHYLYDTTVDYLPRFIEIAQATGKRLMRVDQCLEDPDAPPLK